MNRQQNLTYLQARLARLRRYNQARRERLESVFGVRLLIGTVFFVLLVAIAMNLWIQALIVTEAVLMTLFFLGVRYSRQLQKHIDQVECIIGLYERLSKRLNFQADDVAVAEPNEKWIHHPLSQDLDLVGHASLLNMLDETIHVEGQTRLIESLLEGKFSKEEVLVRQAQVQTLAQRSGLIRKYLRLSHNDVMKGSFGLGELLKESFVFEGFGTVYARLWVLCGLFWSAFFVQEIFLTNFVGR